VGLVPLILVLLMVTNFGGDAESLVAVGFLSFFFLSLLRLLNTISTPFKVGTEHTDDDVSLFLLSEFVVHAQAAEEGEMVVEDIDEAAEEVEEQLVEVEERTCTRQRLPIGRPLRSRPTNEPQPPPGHLGDFTAREEGGARTRAAGAA
jgi:hypothetical protein